MNPLSRLSCAILATLLTGCGSLPSDLRKAIPDGQWKSVRGTVTGKFSATKFEATGVVKTGKVLTAEEIHARHSNVWVPLIEFDAEGYVALKK